MGNDDGGRGGRRRNPLNAENHVMGEKQNKTSKKENIKCKDLALLLIDGKITSHPTINSYVILYFQVILTYKEPNCYYQKRKCEQCRTFGKR